MSAYAIRLSRFGDAAAFSEVETDAAQLLAAEPSLAGIPVPPSRSAEEYRSMIAQRHCLTAVVGDEVVGFAATRPHGRELHLHELSVASGFQRMGIGGTLLRALKIDAQNAGMRAITLHTYRDLPWNTPFYARHGWSPIDDLSAHPRLAAGQDAAVAFGLPRERRCAMICLLD
ncbi:GNAT family N-acetyltransferase [Alteriqipengyuania lutimaris]|uniref:GNAT family N-acetyltransferase n=1 Tax=Alteriqipengyuania lutimaris TaxID=1538146 RepID=A0A395LI30_9SPHN|nr:GNAT family N-acetyltransferase [Alteriqipengyuania lutimaris]MBB3034842.1 GNAT superfamily N-acetyltransferase [Alteriqipengyuania lutimaris]RDS76321.1 GNAT family N-acetyltransferase [Alteriqipengyuania lutimaris]